jgi:hypothetical protein
MLGVERMFPPLLPGQPTSDKITGLLEVPKTLFSSAYLNKVWFTALLAGTQGNIFEFVFNHHANSSKPMKSTISAIDVKGAEHGYSYPPHHTVNTSM